MRQYVCQVTVYRVCESLAMGFNNQPRLPRFNVSFGFFDLLLCSGFGAESFGNLLAVKANNGPIDCPALALYGANCCHGCCPIAAVFGSVGLPSD